MTVCTPVCVVDACMCGCVVGVFVRLPLLCDVCACPCLSVSLFIHSYLFYFILYL